MGLKILSRDFTDRNGAYIVFFRKVFSGKSKLKKTLKVDAFYFEILGIDVGPSVVF